MEEDECAKMLDHLQQYVPHLEKLIAQLKDPKRKNRELQLNKLEGLHSMITDRKKKLKLDTLKKCEDVILKILHKVHPTIFKQLQPKPPESRPAVNMIKFVCKDPPEERNKVVLNDASDIINSLKLKAARARLSEVAITPASPSPPRDIPLVHAPIVIPTEKIHKLPPNPNEFQINNWDNTFDTKSRLGTNRHHAENYKTEKPDVYRKAAESLSYSSNNTKKIVFDRLGTRVDMSKPPLSAEDLQQLTAPEREVYFDDAQNLSMGELEDLREVLQMKLHQSEDRMNMPDLRNKLTRENPNKVKEKEHKVQSVVKPVPPVLVSKPKSPRVEKIYKNPDSKFGNLLSSIDEQILGDTVIKKKDKKEHTKEEKHVKSEQKCEKDPKKDATKKERHSSERKDKDSKSERKSHKDDKKEYRDHKKDRSSSKDKESEKNRSSSLDKSKEHKSKHHDKKPEGKSNKREESTEHKSEVKTEIKDVPKTDTKLTNSEETTANSTENKETPVYRRLADKYNPRPRKSSTEMPDKKVVEINQKIDETCHKSPMFDSNFQTHKDTNVSDRIPSAAVVQTSVQSITNQWHEKKSSVFEPPRDKAPLMGVVLPSNRKPPLLNIPPMVAHPFMQSATNQSSMQMNFVPNKQMVHQNDIIPHKNQFIPPQQNLLNQNIPANRGGNTYMNNFVPQNNVNNNISHTQFKSPLNATQGTFHNQILPNKAFRPYDPIAGGSEYDISKMPTVDFYSPQATHTKRPLLSPPNYANRPPFNPPFPPRDRPPYMARPKFDQWTQDVKGQWHDRNHIREREEPCRQGVSRDPRIRAREMKEQKERANYGNVKEPPAPPPIQMRRKSIDEHGGVAHTKYDSIYSNLDRGRTKEETFISPLDSLYAAPETSQKTGKGYGVQKFRIPKKKNEFEDKYQNEEIEINRHHHVEKEVKKEECSKDIPEKVTIKNEIKEVIQEEIIKVPPEAVQNDVQVVEKSEGKLATPTTSMPPPSTSASEVKSSGEDGKQLKASPSEQSIITDFIANLIQSSKKQELLNAILSTLTGNISDVQTKKFKRIQKIVDSDSDEEDEETAGKKPEAIDFKTEPKAEKVEIEKQAEEEAKPIEDAKVKTKDAVMKKREKIEDQQTLPEETISKEDADEDNNGEDGEEEEEEEEENDETNEKDKETKTKIPKSPTRKRKRRAPVKKTKKVKTLRSKQSQKQSARAKTKNVQPSEELEDNVIETVGERIKNRRRNVKVQEIPKSRKCRSELDMLHEDIKEMFIRDGVLTATGKRMCRILKTDPEAVLEADAGCARNLRNKLASPIAVETTSALDSPKRRARSSNPKVVIEKTDLSKLITSKSKEDSESENESLETTRLRAKTRQMNRRRSCVDTESTASDSSSLSPMKRSVSKRNIKSKPNYIEDTDEEPLPPSTSEPEESSKQDTEEPEVDSNLTPKNAVSKRSSKKKKRGQNWALGVIKKSKKKVPSNTTTPTPSVDGDQDSHSDFGEPTEESLLDEEESDTEYVEPDKNYYFDPQDKSECKLCAFKGKMIVQHYKTVHAKHEVLISRIAPDNASKAIEESTENGFEDIEATDTWEAKNRRKKYIYQCRFCQVFFKNENSESFFDHLTGHTGEYRFICTFCPFKTANSKSLRAHLHSSHNSSAEQSGAIMPTYQAPPNFHMVFGYLCGECNFIQMDRATVETHVKIYHLGENKKIYKINMSTVMSKAALVVEPAEKVPPVEPIEDIAEKDVVAEKEQKETSSPEQKSEKPQESVVVQPVKEVVKENQTVFKDNTAYQQENKKLDEQKHEKMKEINKTIVPKKKFTFNFVDKIKSRLDDKNTEAIIVANSDVDTSDMPMELENSADTSTNNANKSGPVESCDPKKGNSKSDSKPSLESGTEKSIVNKTFVPISNIIERLQGKLNVDSVQPPPLIPLNEFKLKVEPKQEDVVVRVGPVGATKKNSYILYICYMQSCMFSSMIQTEFEIHCRNFHGNNQWDGFCSICNINTSFTEVEEAYNHLISMHSNDFEDDQSISGESNESQSQTKSYLRMRRLSGDKLSENRFDASGNDSVILASDESFCKIVNVESEQEVVEDKHSFPFHISNVTTLTPEEDQALNTPVTTNIETLLPTLTVIKTTAGAGGITTVSSPTTSPIAIPIPLQGGGASYSFVLPMLTTAVGKPSPTKFSATPSLLVPVKPSVTLTTSKPLTPIKAKGQPKRIMLKDTPLQPHELTISRKTANAMSCLLLEPKLMHLYKCPERNCTYSTDIKKQFEAHLHQHTEFKPGMQIPCLYCNFKTDVDFISVHYDIRHGRCEFCCVYCFYRGLTQSYVEMHQEREHSKSPRRVLMVPVNRDALMSQAHISLPPLKSVIPLYECGQLGCTKKFIFPDDFCTHLRSTHWNTPLLCVCCQYSTHSAPEVIAHMQSHNVCYYHCRYCIVGANTMDDIYKHLSHQHFAMSPKIILRHFIPGKTGKSQADYQLDAPELLEHLKTITIENYKYITPNARFEVVSSSVTKKQGLRTSPVKKTPPAAVAATPLKAEKETIAVYKGKKSNVLFRIVEQQSGTVAAVDQKKNVSVEEQDKQDNDDVEIVQVSDDESTPTVQGPPTGQTLTKKFSKGVRPNSPIVLNKFLGSPNNLLTLTQTIPSSIASTIAEQPMTAVAATPTQTVIEAKSATDFIIVQPETDTDTTLEDPLLDMTLEVPEKSTTEDVDPLQLELEACSAVSEENIGDAATEHTFTEANIDVVGNFSFSEDGEVQEFSDLTADEVSFSVDNTTKKQGLVGRDLFRCGCCRAGFEGAQLFRAHVTKCMEVNKIGSPRPFKCCHCVKAFKSCNSLLDHVRLHGTLRFACSLCDFKHQHQLHVRSHMKTGHSVSNVSIMPVDPNKRNYDEDEFVVRPKINRQKSTDSSSGIGSNSGTTVEDLNKQTKLSYGPDEITTLPIRPIFSKEIKCSDCGYETKVRANLVRHFQFHKTGKEMPVPAIAPVNPVPCLEKNEKMFDKMTNLALSSYADSARMASKVEKKTKSGLTKEEEAQLPVFVPANKRYVCGASYCDYLCLEESMLRYHLLALHSDETLYKCTHCSTKLTYEKGVINVDSIVKHLRLHDLHLYKCKYCTFLHNMKHKVDRHVLDKHSDHPPIVIIVRELEHEPEEQPHYQEPEEVKGTRPWRCGMCKYRCPTRNEIAAHVYNKHSLDSQYKCALCSFRSNKISAFPSHFATEHPGQNIDIIDAYYEVGEISTAAKTGVEGQIFDTTPLWQRDKNKFKHIRGIPIDETNKMPKKSPLKQTNSSDNLDKAIEAVASGTVGVAEKDLSALKPKKARTLKEKKLEFSRNEGSTNDFVQIDNDVAELISVDSVRSDKEVGAIEDDKKTVDTSDIEDPLSKLRIDELITLKKVELSNMEDDANTTKLSLEDIQNMDLDTLKNSDMWGTYGPYGRPYNKQFLCPLCGTFKTRKGENMNLHLYKELHYPRFVCTSCGLTGLTYTFLQKHSAKKHIGLPEAIHLMSPDPQIEGWVHKVLAVQRRIISGTESVATVSSTTVRNEVKIKEPVTVNNEDPKEQQKAADCSSPKSSITIAEEMNTPDSSSTLDTDSPLSKGKQIHQCQHCSYSCKSASDLRKHEKRHWVQKPLKCGYCDVEGVTNYEVIQHSKRAHPGMDALVIAVPTPSTPTIKPIMRKRKYPGGVCEISSSSDEPSVKHPVLETVDPTEDSLPCEEAEVDVDNSYVLVCNFCPKRGDSESDLRTHWEAMHKSRQPVFKCRKVMRSQLIKKGTIKYKCCYCSSIGTMEILKKHFRTNHPDVNFAVFRYKCPHCEQFFKNMDKFRSHCKQIHNDVDPLPMDIDESVDKDKPSYKSKDYVCEYCDMEFEMRQEIVDHHKAVHSHLELNLPPNLSVQATTPSKEEDDTKKYMCPQCLHRSNSYAAMRDHVRSHAKPFQCGHCSYRNTYPSLVKVHHAKEHPSMEFKWVAIQEGKELNDNLRRNLLVLSEDGSYTKIKFKNSKRTKSDQSTQPNKVRVFEFEEDIPHTEKFTARKSTTQLSRFSKPLAKKTARKSTTQWLKPSVNEGFSYYGNKPDLDGIENLKTTLSFNESMVPVSVMQLKGIFDIFPTVTVVDIKTQL